MIPFTLAFMLFFTSISFNKSNTTAPGKNVTISLLGDHAEAKRIKFPINNKKPSKPQKPSTPKPPKKGFKNGAEGEKFLNKLVKGNGHKTFDTTKGKRIVDVYVNKTKWAHESKVGYASKTKFIKKQVDKDVLLLKKKRVEGVKWHFFRSAKTGKVGASKPLLKYLNEKKVPYQIHK